MLENECHQECRRLGPASGFIARENLGPLLTRQSPSETTLRAHRSPPNMETQLIGERSYTVATRFFVVSSVGGRLAPPTSAFSSDDDDASYAHNTCADVACEAAPPAACRARRHDARASSRAARHLWNVSAHEEKPAPKCSKTWRRGAETLPCCCLR